MLRVVRNILGRIGFTQIDEASDGETALAKLRARPYQFVVTDWTMAPMSGGELLQRVLADARLAETPFVMIAASDRGDVDRVTARAGWCACAPAPLTAAVLKAKIETILGALPAPAPA
jgi:two-component system chemotaxis response regulator CheY